MGVVHVPDAGMPQRIELCSTDDLAPGDAMKVETPAGDLAVFNVGGAFFVTDDACTHGQASLAEGFVDGEVVECYLHSGQFNVRTGEAVSAPCTAPVKTYPAIVEGGKIFVEI
jgi:nitrite reductase/ring-hydroxylating ferredoxin subunit